jgi:membrane protease YdiL (CAAX protease family)
MGNQSSFSEQPVQSGTSVFQHLFLNLILLMVGLAVLLFGANTFKILPTNKNLTYNLIVSSILLLGALWVRTSQVSQKYWEITIMFFIASVVYPITWVTIGWKEAIFTWLGLTVASSQGLALDKILQMVFTIVPILVLVRAAGFSFRSIYLQRGDLKTGLGIGILVLFNLITSTFLFFGLRFSSMDDILAAILYGLVFAFANGFLEELWLRAIFLRPLVPHLGVNGSILLTSIIFASIHAGATYFKPISIPFMLVNTLTLGLACGYLIVKTNSIWGAVLIHAAADFFLFFALLAKA